VSLSELSFDEHDTVQSRCRFSCPAVDRGRRAAAVHIVRVCELYDPSGGTRPKKEMERSLKSLTDAETRMILEALLDNKFSPTVAQNNVVIALLSLGPSLLIPDY
jgi:hypothetical protein